ncbi:MAG: PKD domain-containing protein [Owenweeksia sp.]|nr:PKD domain-containing protein [Owenweeksia sp.]
MVIIWPAALSINLTSYAGLEGVRLKFVVVNGSGNNLYLDNVQISGNPTTAPTAAFGSLTEFCALDSLQFLDQSYGSPTAWQWRFTGPDTLSASARDPKLWFTKPGQYEVSLAITNNIGQDTITKSNYLTVNPADSARIWFNFSNDSICPGGKINAHSGRGQCRFTGRDCLV